jgi:hypothetical protein
MLPGFEEPDVAGLPPGKLQLYVRPPPIGEPLVLPDPLKLTLNGAVHPEGGFGMVEILITGGHETLMGPACTVPEQPLASVIVRFTLNAPEPPGQAGYVYVGFCCELGTPFPKFHWKFVMVVGLEEVFTKVTVMGAQCVGGIW